MSNHPMIDSVADTLRNIGVLNTPARLEELTAYHPVVIDGKADMLRTQSETAIFYAFKGLLDITRDLYRRMDELQAKIDQLEGGK